MDRPGGVEVLIIKGWPLDQQCLRLAEATAKWQKLPVQSTASRWTKAPSQKEKVAFGGVQAAIQLVMRYSLRTLCDDFRGGAHKAQLSEGNGGGEEEGRDSPCIYHVHLDLPLVLVEMLEVSDFAGSYTSWENGESNISFVPAS